MLARMILLGTAIGWPFALLSGVRAAERLDLSRAAIVSLNPQSPIEANAADMLRDEIERRTRIGLEVVRRAPAERRPLIVVGRAAELAAAGYEPPRGGGPPARPDGCAVWIDAARPTAPVVCVAGHDQRGVLYAVGRLLRALRMTRDRVTLDLAYQVATAPRYALRGHQFGYRPKTNSYDGWTLSMWEQYYRDMIVFGMNAIELIPPRSDDDADSPHFPKPQLEMMAAMSRLADDYGLDVWIWYPAIDDDYTDPATVRAALKEREEVFRALPRVDALFVPGGDPGDTHPKILLPFMKQQKAVLNRYHPDAQIWVSPQGFDRPGRNRDGWLQAFFDILQQQRPGWLDGVVFGPQVETDLATLRREVPSQYPIRRYPDITHCRSCQYEVPDWDEAYRRTLGREPINPRPTDYAKIFRDWQQYAVGFIAYSEGCNDDVNKVVWSCLGWDPDMEVERILREYSRYFIGPAREASFAEGLLALERNWRGPLLANEGVMDTLRRFREMERTATPQELLNWRFQQGLYRAYYDAYVRRRLLYERELEQRAMDWLRAASQVGSLTALDRALAELERAKTDKVGRDLRARVFELAEALFQSARMQLSVPKYQAIRVSRGANLDEIDRPLFDDEDLPERLRAIRRLDDEQERLEAIRRIAG